MQQIGLPQNIIIDTDMGWDDILAILLLIKNPNVNLLGITVTGCGETHLDSGTFIARTLVELGNSDAVVCGGAATPSAHDNQFPAEFRAAMDSVCGLLDGLPKPTRPLDPRPAWDFMRDSLREEENQITILSLGGLTNVARLLELDPGAKLENIERIVVMGGAVNSDGNVSLLNNAKPEYDQGPQYASNVYAEWNIFIDALAAKKVFASKIPMTLVPLDACDYVMLTSEYEGLVTAEDPVARLAKDLLKAKSDPNSPAFEAIPLPVFDPLAAMVMVGLETLGSRTQMVLDVEAEQTDHDNTCGRTYPVIDCDRRPITVVNTVSARQFGEAFSLSINAPLRPLPGENVNKTAALLFFDNVEIQDLAGVYEVLAAARNEDGSAVYEVVTVSCDREPKHANAGVIPSVGGQSCLMITPDYGFENAPAFDHLVVIGGQGIDALLADDAQRKAYVSWIKTHASAATTVSAVCSGAMLLAHTGLLHDVEATTHHTRFRELQALSDRQGLNLTVVDTRGGLNFAHSPGSRLRTSGGVHCAIALACELVGQDLGLEAKHSLASEVLEYTVPRGRNGVPPGFPKPRNMDPRDFLLGFSHLNIIMRDVEMMDEATAFYKRTLGYQEAWSVWLRDESQLHFGRDAGFGSEPCRVMVRFLIHPNTQTHIELMYYEFPKGEQAVSFHRTNDVGGIRHAAFEVTDAIEVYHFLKNQEGVRMLSDSAPERLSPDPQTFFYWIDPYGVQWEMEEGRPMERVISGIVG